MSETQLLRQVLAFLAAEPDVVAYRCNSGGIRRGGRFVHFGLGDGAPDVIAIIGPLGRLCGLELKVGTNEPTDAQKRWGEAATRSGAVYRVCRSVDDALAAVALARRSEGDVEPARTLAELARERLAAIRAGGLR